MECPHIVGVGRQVRKLGVDKRESLALAPSVGKIGSKREAKHPGFRPTLHPSKGKAEGAYQIKTFGYVWRSKRAQNAQKIGKEKDRDRRMTKRGQKNGRMRAPLSKGRKKSPEKLELFGLGAGRTCAAESGQGSQTFAGFKIRSSRGMA